MSYPSGQEDCENAVRLYGGHCEKSGESFELPDSGQLLTPAKRGFCLGAIGW